MKKILHPSATLPTDAARALLVGRLWMQDTGPVLVLVSPRGVLDLSSVAATACQLMELPDVARRVRSAEPTLPLLAATADVLANSALEGRDTRLPWLLAPCDLQAIKAAGVTFVSSMLERVIEEQAAVTPARPKPCARQWSA